MQNKINLPPQLARLYFALPKNKDVPIKDLYIVIYGEPKDDMERSRQQQYIGPAITKLNRRIVGIKERVTPGKLKGTYRLTSL